MSWDKEKGGYFCDNCKYCLIYNYDNIPLTADIQITACEITGRILNKTVKSKGIKTCEVITPYWCPLIYEGV